MNINASIIEQRLIGIQQDIQQKAYEILNITDDARLKSLAFVYLCTKTTLDLDNEEAFDCLTEGSGDFGVDALHLSDVIDGEFEVTLFQAKYKQNLKADANFPESGIKALIYAIQYLFNPSAQLGNINSRLESKVELIRGMIQDGYIPRVRAIACNNGLIWNDNSQATINATHFGDQVTWDYINHDNLVSLLQNIKPINETLKLTGKAIIEDLNFSRVCIGRISVIELAQLIKNYGERLLERNIRRYLGLQSNRVNEGIRSTLISDDSYYFYFFNNGLTLVCSDFNYNALQNEDYRVQVDNLQIVNGGQTCMTIYKTIEEMQKNGQDLPINASVLVRIYKLPKENQDIVWQITYATNSQNPVDLKDLRSNDEKQKQLENSIEYLGYHYRRKRIEGSFKSTDITSGASAEAILSVWRRSPHQAKFMVREHFGKLYNKIFTPDLNGTQTVIAVLLYRIAENRRRRPTTNDPMFVRYASCFIAMQMGSILLRNLNITLDNLDHRYFNQAKFLIEKNGEHYFNEGVHQITDALNKLYGKKDISMQQLSATFRRGDLIEMLQN